MNEHEANALAERVATKVAEQIHGTGCPMGWTPADAKTLSEFAATLRTVKATALTTLVGVFVAFVLYAVLAGLPTTIAKKLAGQP